MKRQKIFGLAAALLLAVSMPVLGSTFVAQSPGELLGSTFVAQSPGELLADSDAVVVGEVIQKSSFWNEDMSVIVTEAAIHVHDTLMGDAPAVVNVRTPGGTVGKFRIDAHGFPTFSKGQRVLLFLHRTPEGNLEVTGYKQGQYRVVTRTDGVDVAVPSLDGVRLLTKDGAAAPAPRAMTLDNFRSMLRAEARGMHAVAK